MGLWSYHHILGTQDSQCKSLPVRNWRRHQSCAGSFYVPIAQTEDSANEVLEKLGTNGNPGARYVVSNAYMAYAILTVFAEWDETNFGYYAQIQTSQGPQVVPTMKYYDTMEAKLHIFDTNGLHNYRLVHESTPNPYTRVGI